MVTEKYELKKMSAIDIERKHIIRDNLINLMSGATIIFGVLTVAMPIIGVGILGFIANKVWDIRDLLYEKDSLDFIRIR